MLRMTVLVIVVLALSMPVHAKPKPDKQHKTSGQATVEPADLNKRGTFSPAERNMIRAHLVGKQHATTKHRDLPPGLQKKAARGKPLPPGWQKKLEPGHSLEYHVYRQGESLPEDLLKRLPPPPVGSEILQVDEKIILLNSTTRTILDLFDLAPAR